MSTNFYWTPSAESPLACFGQLHIGKRSGGWSFSFQAFEFAGRPAETRYIEVGEGLHITVPVPELPALVVKSLEDWKSLLSQPGSTLACEYGSPYSYEEFMEMVNTDLHPTKGTWGAEKRPLQNHYDHRVQHVSMYGPVNPSRDWKDSAGYAFSLDVFS